MYDTVGLKRWACGGAMAALVVSAAFTQPAVARDAGSHGGGGGAPFRLECEAGEIATALHTYAGSALDAISVQCGVLSADGKSFQDTNSTGDAGGAGGTSLKFGCPPDNGAKELYVWNDKHNIVNHVEMACVPLAGGGITVVKPSRIGGNPIQPAMIFKCDGPNEWVVGVYGRAGSLIDAIGPICGTRVPKRAAPPPPGKPDPQEVSDMDPKGKTAEECTAAWGRNEKRCELRHRGNPSPLSACLQQVKQIYGACISLAAQDVEPAEPQGRVVKVVEAVTGYDTPEGNDKCYPVRGDTAEFIGELAGDPTWKHLKGTSGDCDGQDFWVYDEGQLRF